MLPVTVRSGYFRNPPDLVNFSLILSECPNLKLDAQIGPYYRFRIPENAVRFSYCAKSKGSNRARKNTSELWPTKSNTMRKGLTSVIFFDAISSDT
jgi:hypothetical protein